MSAGHWRAAHAVVASLLFLAPHRALATAVFEQTNTTGEILIGQSSSDSASTTIVSQGNVAFPGPTTTTMRVGFNINADAAPGLTAIEIGTARFDLSFDLAHAPSFDLIFDFLLRGQLLRFEDQECLGSIALADIEIPTLVRLSDGAEFPIGVVLPGASIVLGGTTESFTFAQQNSRTLQFRGQTVDSNRYQLTFDVSATALSQSCEVSARFGADNGSTTGCDACVYPGIGDRVRDDDGLFVTVTAVSLCGNGTPDAGEKCDEGAANGTAGSTCDAFCRPQHTFTVTNADDGGEGSLRTAMGLANLTEGADTIVFDPVFFSTPRTITLDGSLPPINEDLTINGPGAHLLTVSGDGKDRVFEVASGVPARLRGLTITEGLIDGPGAGIHSEGPLMLTNVAVVGNQTTSDGGGGVFLAAGGVFTNCTFSGNTSTLQGGGIEFRSDGGRTLRLFDSTVSGNSAPIFGGGIFHLSVDGSGTLDIVNSTIADNDAATGGGIMTGAGADGSPVTTVRNTIVANNDGGDLVALADPGGTPTVTSLGFNLTSDDGGGFLNGTDDQINTDPLLGPLQYNGGETPTRMLLAGSPALDNGEAGGVDQRGVARRFEIPGVGSAGNGDASDIGAVEVHALIVSSTDDSGIGSLRQALTDANANTDLDDILFDDLVFNVPRTIRLASALPVIAKDLTINGPAANRLTVSGNHQSRVLEIAGRVRASLSGLTITEGDLSGPGAGIRSAGPLTLTNVAVVGNRARGAAGGGVALFATDGVFTSCTFSGNTTSVQGGGIEFRSDGGHVLRLIDSTISGNSSANTGGGIYYLSLGGSGRLEVVSSTIAENSAASASGGGILTAAGAAGNVVTTLRNTIIANNRGSDLVAGADPGGAFDVTSRGFNLTSDGGGGFLDQASDQIDRDPLLGPLQNNGGDTPTHMLLAGSPALDKGNSAGVGLDQRGRPRGYDVPDITGPDGGDSSDIGAVEVQALIVKNADDNGLGSLRQVVGDAPSNSDVLFDASFFNVARTIALTSGDILIDKDQTINGPGASLLAISGSNASRIFRIPAGGLDVAISGVTIKDGRAADFGAGGGIVSESNLTLSRCIIANNTAGSDAQGGGVQVRDGLATFTDCAFKDNTAPGSGGAVFLIDATGTFTRCTLSGNESGDRGGAVAMAGSSAEFTNCTISGNMAPMFGGGLALFTVNSDQTLTVTNSTVTANTGSAAAGIRVESFGLTAAATVRNSIVARNFGPNLQTVESGGSAMITSLGYNLNDDDNTFFNQPTDQIDTNPELGPLQNNGGFTETHALLPDSPAIDKGSSFGSPTDQRGFARPSDDPALPNAEGGDGADIGAFEVQVAVPTPTSTPTATATVTPTPTATSTAIPGICTGDCNASDAVTVDELVLGVNIALGTQPASACVAFDRNRNDGVAIDELVAGVNNALDGCPP